MKTIIKPHTATLIAVLIGFPLLYLGLGLTPWAFDLFVKGDGSSYFPFWLTVILLHWVTLFIVLRIVRKQGLTLKDIGYGLSVKKSAILIGCLLTAGFLIAWFTEMSLGYVTLDAAKVEAMGGFFPKTAPQRFLFVFVALSAGFCEEIIYRGYAISGLRAAGVNKWLALVPAGISFAFVHGMGALPLLPFYFGAATVFGLLYLLTKRLWPGIILHTLFDLMAIMAIMGAAA